MPAQSPFDPEHHRIGRVLCFTAHPDDVDFGAAGTIAAYLIQENIETASTGAPLPGVGVLGGEHAIGLPVLFAVSLVIAVVAALVGWRREVLLARIRAAARGRLRAPAATLRPALAAARLGGRREGRRNGVRAPPLGLIRPA